MESTIVHIPGEKEAAKDRAITARLRELARERRRLIAEGRQDEVLSNAEMVKLAKSEASETVEPASVA